MVNDTQGKENIKIDTSQRKKREFRRIPRNDFELLGRQQVGGSEGSKNGKTYWLTNCDNENWGIIKKSKRGERPSQTGERKPRS